jgi:preprotein translocase subunit YajC
MSLLDLLIAPAHAQAAGAAAGQPSPYASLVMLGVFVVVFFFLIIRPQMKRAKEQREMLSKLAKGDEVVTSGGIAGRVVELGESFIGVEIAEGTVVKFQKGAIGAVLPKGTLKAS